jgi:hypothetical protein
MTDVLRNVGELASPYYLLELWVRQWEIDLDPETYATLKRKTRSLVRDLRGFEHRGEQVDEDWRARRREILGLVSFEESVANIDAGELAVLLAPTAPDGPRLLVGELDPGVDPDRRDPDRDLEEPPATAFELVLESADRDVAWGLLICGLELRLYRRGTGISQQYLAMELDGLVELNDEDFWRAFAGLFRLPAARPDADGVPLIQRVCDESRAHATRLADDMRGDVVYAAETLIQGALDASSNRFKLGDPPSLQSLHRLFQESLYVLYRLLFVLYAESRDILPMSSGGPYATTYSLDHLVERARRGAEPPPGVTYTADAVRRLFRLLDSGPEDAASKLGIQVLGGELFDAHRTSLFDQLEIPETDWREALKALAIGAPGSDRARFGRRSSFAELGVDQLGSIYEGLLVLEPRLVEEPSVLVGPMRERRVLPPELTGDKRVIRDLAPGTFVLESSSGRRKGTGSFYTPAEITEFLAGAAIEPLVEPLIQLATEGDASRAEKELLAIRVCDPAMGSGAFLVQATRVLGRSLARIRAIRAGVGVTPDAIRRAEAEVVRRCIYGVDLNPLAVTLAKVSLWLETLQRGRPLTFLDAHLRVGDSLVGADLLAPDRRLRLDDIIAWPKAADVGLKEYLKKIAGPAGEPMSEQLKARKPLKGRTQPTLPGMAAHEVSEAIAEFVAERERLTGAPDPDADLFQLELDAEQRFRALERDEDAVRNRVRAAADFWCAQWFWPADPEAFEAFDVDPTARVIPPPGEGDFQAIVAQLLNPSRSITGDQQAMLDVGRAVAAEHKFFHWALEFPEVMVDRGGFDAVIGNPPWNTVSPDVKEFFSTFDPVTFKKGVPKNKQNVRRAQICEDEEIDRRWRDEARRLHELGAYVKPKAGRYLWFAQEGNLRKGDANVFRQFVERGYMLTRRGGRVAQVLPDSVYVSSPATELRRRLLADGRLEFCFVFENRKLLFPIDSRIKIVLLGAEAGGGPTDDFAAAFITGKDAAGRDRAISLPDLPATLTALATRAPRMTREQVETLSPQTFAFPELVTPLDAEIAVAIANRLPPLNLDERGWRLKYCAELHSDRDSWRFKTADELTELGATRDGLYWSGPNGQEWWPLVEGALFHNLEFPEAGKEPKYWVLGGEVRAIPGRQNSDGSSVMDHWRVAWRDVARAVDERSAKATLIPPRCAAKDKAPTVWGGSLSTRDTSILAGLMSSFCFDYLVRFRGATSLKYGQVNSVPAPSVLSLQSVVDPVQSLVDAENERVGSSDWTAGEQRARVDAPLSVNVRRDAHHRGINEP